MTLPVSTQITNLKQRAHKLGISSSAIKDIENANDAPKAIILGLKTLIADASAKPSTKTKTKTKDLVAQLEGNPIAEANEASYDAVTTKKSSKKKATKTEAEILGAVAANVSDVEAAQTPKTKTDVLRNSKRIGLAISGKTTEGENGSIVVMRGQGAARRLDVKNTTMNAIRVVYAETKKAVTTDEIEAQFALHNVAITRDMYRVSLGNLSREGRLRKYENDTYRPPVE